ncbi:hypothetical protein [Glycomyces salinus]|uniref:hypothetical protein n=1 Tax=Glycomyces salinus TaxID=980294 RepID=UPI0018ECC68C|nr:hypothetical protein [Glycomyces salinus]
MAGLEVVGIAAVTAFLALGRLDSTLAALLVLTLIVLGGFAVIAAVLALISIRLRDDLRESGDRLARIQKELAYSGAPPVIHPTDKADTDLIGALAEFRTEAMLCHDRTADALEDLSRQVAGLHGRQPNQRTARSDLETV